MRHGRVGRVRSRRTGHRAAAHSLDGPVRLTTRWASGGAYVSLLFSS
ncbi:hypothetical protein UO65_1097 [Actinokineospora spheciospongiae]|uniref:Uncharacterized protein n=1 Tax=Actinokineospora spheciospongiae TaxID=909613 RepID=W7IR41_9PSEU|nr:hypothetical protein UO65_1097 [Actinokineospora spheciospongiae]